MVLTLTVPNTNKNAMYVIDRTILALLLKLRVHNQKQCWHYKQVTYEGDCRDEERLSWQVVLG